MQNTMFVEYFQFSAPMYLLVLTIKRKKTLPLIMHILVGFYATVYCAYFISTSSCALLRIIFVRPTQSFYTTYASSTDRLSFGHSCHEHIELRVGNP